MTKLTQEERDALPDSDFAIPEQRAYPIHDMNHAREALAMVAAHGTPEEQDRVYEAVHKRFPSLKEEDLR